MQFHIPCSVLAQLAGSAECLPIPHSASGVYKNSPLFKASPFKVSMHLTFGHRASWKPCLCCQP
ncbi:hypothetical protein, partial [uncultured Kiloniella sp.]|uniref:hypothetical protein n=1 Tax=uncultured Kiloniella sp. TaxID=1133091 RepID=UPI00260743D5